MKPKVIAYIQLAVAALVIALFLWWIYPEPQVPLDPLPELPLVSTTTSSAVAFPWVPIEAKSAYVFDVATGKELFAKNADLQLPLASLTKLMTAVTASTLLPDYILVRISPDDIAIEGDSGLVNNEEWGISDLIDYSLVVSSNDGVQAIASVAGSRVEADTSKSPVDLFVQRMNTLASEIGLRATYYLNPSGLDVTTSLSGGYGSAKDTALLVDYVLKNKPHLFEATTFDQLTVSSKSLAHVAKNTNKALATIPNVLASKTGFTDLSGGNLVVAFDAGVGHPIIISILGSSYDGRFNDMSALVVATLTYLASSTPAIK
jgi:serine-type D-Ala-D-Ala carboxypeptidase (penicillin-binding protein 5/6)